MEERACTKPNGGAILGFELIITIMCLDSILELRTNLHTFMRIGICIFIAIMIFSIFSINKICCILISLVYSIIWSSFIISIVNEFSQGNKVYIILGGGIAFIISLTLHLDFNEN
ncbi:hypothetical protein FDA48_05680 [Clostridium botulinum]|nr:hypothetical protein [Clostridium botulinum]HBJ1645892.1 hypothetical protein [Clostridium botulinum]